MQITTTNPAEQALTKSGQPSLSNPSSNSEFDLYLKNASDTLKKNKDYIAPNHFQKNTRPNMRELMEALSGKTLEDLYGQNDNEWKKVAESAHNILYGVLGDKDDTRDWKNILTSQNVLTKAQEETAKLHGVKIEVEHNNSTEISEHKYVGVIKDYKDAPLRYLVGSEDYIESSITIFGAKKQAISKEFLAQLALIDVDPKLQSSLDRIINSTAV